MDRKLFCEVGALLYGPRWRTKAAEHFKVAPRTTRRWASGESRIPDGMEAELAHLARRRLVEYDRMIAKLDAAAATYERMDKELRRA